ncbi:hypothetical protein BC830DRAFT_1111843 [Chytriomyces sp. MP71]|nr:hypothetical protein BC830DRAFT_1111843 [Chytriomyces sp. MP71]
MLLPLVLLLAGTLTLAAPSSSTESKALTRQLVYSDLFGAERFSLRFSAEPSQNNAERARVELRGVTVKVGDARFDCYVRTAKSSANATGPTKNDEEPVSPDDADDDPEEVKEADRRNTVWRGINLVHKMWSGKCGSLINGWWHYEVCPASHVRQFHPRTPEEEQKYPKKKQDYFLGKRDPSPKAAYQHADIVEVELNGHIHTYLSMHYDDGTGCDILDNAPRKSEVQFHCNPGQPGDYIQFTRETASCQYLIQVNSATLCQDEAFRPRPIAGPNGAVADANLILCEPIASEATAPSPEGQAKQLSMRDYAAVKPGAVSLTSLYPDVLAAAAKSDPMAEAAMRAALGKAGFEVGAIMPMDEQLANKVQEALNRLMKANVAATAAAAAGKSEAKKGEGMETENGDEVKMIKLVIDENGNVVFDGDDEALKRFFGAAVEADGIQVVQAVGEGAGGGARNEGTFMNDKVRDQIINEAAKQHQKVKETVGQAQQQQSENAGSQRGEKGPTVSELEQEKRDTYLKLHHQLHQDHLINERGMQKPNGPDGSAEHSNQPQDTSEAAKQKTWEDHAKLQRELHQEHLLHHRGMQKPNGPGDAAVPNNAHDTAAQEVKQMHEKHGQDHARLHAEAVRVAQEHAMRAREARELPAAAQPETQSEYKFTYVETTAHEVVRDEDGNIVRQQANAGALRKVERGGIEGPNEAVTVDAADGSLEELKEKVRQALTKKGKNEGIEAGKAKVEEAKAILTERLRKLKEVGKKEKKETRDEL